MSKGKGETTAEDMEQFLTRCHSLAQAECGGIDSLNSLSEEHVGFSIHRISWSLLKENHFKYLNLIIWELNIQIGRMKN